MSKLVIAAAILATLAIPSIGCGGDDDDANTELTATWKFESGDCASNAIEKIHLTLTPSGGAASTQDVPCTAGTADLGKIHAGSYGLTAEGVDAGGKTRFVSVQSASFPQGKVLGPLDMTLRPKPSKVTVTWNGCPPGVILPYHVTLFRAAPDGTATTTTAGTADASCQASSATVENVLPGNYIADVDDRAVVPAVKGSRPVTVTAGEDTTVAVPVP